MLTRKKIALIVLLVAGIAGIFVWAQSISVKDSIGATITLPGKAVRIVSLSPALTETIYAVGSSTIGNTTYCNYPESAKNVQKIGGYSAKTVNIETIIALKPDLVIGELNAHKSLLEPLTKAGLKVMLIKLETFDDIYNGITLIGQVTGNGKTATDLIASLKRRIALVAEKIQKIPDDKRPTLFWEVWHEPLMTAGPNTFIGQIITASGAKNIFADLTENWPVVSFEAVLTKNPMYIASTLSHGPEMDNTKLKQRTGWSSMSAVVQNRLLLFNDDIFSRPGPRFVDAIELLAKVLYPELFK